MCFSPEKEKAERVRESVRYDATGLPSHPASPNSRPVTARGPPGARDVGVGTPSTPASPNLLLYAALGSPGDGQPGQGASRRETAGDLTGVTSVGLRDPCSRELSQLLLLAGGTFLAALDAPGHELSGRTSLKRSSQRLGPAVLRAGLLHVPLRLEPAATDTPTESSRKPWWDRRGASVAAKTLY